MDAQPAGEMSPTVTKDTDSRLATETNFYLFQNRKRNLLAMELTALYARRNDTDDVPHLVVDLRCVNFSREDEDFHIILLICIRYKVKILEIKVLTNTLDNSFLVSDFDSVFGNSLDAISTIDRKELFAYGIRRLLFDSNEHLWRSMCQFMLMHSAARTLDIYSVSSGQNIDTYLKSISKWNMSDNYCIQKITFRTGNSTGPRLLAYITEIKCALDRILHRNRRLFLKKQRTALLLVGLTRRKPALQKICKDVLILIAKTVIRTPGSQVWV